MEALTVVGFLMFLFLGWIIWSKLTWKTIMVGSDIQSEEAIRKKYKQLKSNNIRCHLKRETQSPVVIGINPMISNHAHAGYSSTLKLMVHRRDIYKVNQLQY